MAIKRILREELDRELIDHFTLHMYQYEKDIKMSSKNIFELNSTMIYGVSNSEIIIQIYNF